MKKFLSVVMAIIMLSLISTVMVLAAPSAVDFVDTVSPELVIFEKPVGVLSSDGTSVTYTVKKNETFSFENIGEVALDITGLSCYTDYVIYYMDGSIKAYDDNVRLNTVNVPAGGKLCITNLSDSSMGVVLDDSYFIVEQLENPVMKRVTALKGENHIITNTSKVAYNILGVSYYFNMVKYDTAGNIVEYNIDMYLGDYSLSAGYSLKVSQTYYDSVTYVLLYDKFTIEKSDSHVFDKIVAFKGESCIIKNISNTAYSICGISYSNDYELYDTEGNLVQYGHDAYLGDYSLPSGYSIKISQIYYGNNTYHLLHGKFSVEKSDTPVFDRITAYRGESYIIKNISNTAYSICGISYSNDYELYDTEGNLVQYGHDAYLGDYSLPSGYSIKISQIYYGNNTYHLLHGKFSVEKSNIPVFDRTVAYKGESYIIKNISNTAYSICGISYSNDYELYDTEGNLVQYGHDAYLGDYSLPSGYSIKISQIYYGNNTYHLLHGKFSVEKSDIPVFDRIRGYKGETYTFTNISGKAATITGGRADYIIYYSNGAVKSTASNKDVTNEIAAGGSIKVTITSDSMDIYSLHGTFDATLETEGKQYFDLELGKTYAITNVGNNNKKLALNGGGTWSFVRFDAEGIYDEAYLFTTDSISLPKGSTAYVEASALTRNSLAIDDELSIEEHYSSVVKMIYAKENQIYKITNTGARNHTVYLTGIGTDYIMYNADDTIASFSNDSTSGSYSIPMNGYILISYNECPGQFYFLNDYFECEEYEWDPLYTTTQIPCGQTYKFKNASAVDRSIRFGSGCYDYIIYKADGTINKTERVVSYETINVPAGETLFVTPLMGSMTVTSLTHVFDIGTRSYPVYKRTFVGTTGKTKITNVGNEDMYIYSISSELLNYVTYDGGANPQEAKERVSTNSIKVPAGGYAEITMIMNAVDFAGLYEFFTEEDLSVAVTDITLSQNAISLVKGKQTVIRATITPDDATNKNVTWSSSDTSVATVAQTGKVVAKAPGTATITVTTIDGEYSATCLVTVTETEVANVAVTGVSLNKSSLDLAIGETATLSANVAPSNATNKSVTWTSTNPSVAKVNSNGVVTAVDAGNAVVIVTTNDGGKTAFCSVSVSGIPTEDPICDNCGGAHETEDCTNMNFTAKVTLSDVSGRQGEMVKVVVELDTLEAINTIGLKDIRYDGSVLTFAGFSDYESLANICALSSFDNDKMAVVAGLKDTQEFHGKLCSLNFIINEDAEECDVKISLTASIKNGHKELSTKLIPSTVTVRSQILGDLNLDEYVDISDAILLLQHSMFPDLYPIAYSGSVDFVKDGFIDISDAILLLQYSMFPDLYPIG